MTARELDEGRLEELAAVLCRWWDDFEGDMDLGHAEGCERPCPPCRDEAAAIAPLVAGWLAEAEAGALREALNDWQWGQWTVLTPKVKHGGASAVVGGAQAVTDWLRDRADRIGGGA